MIQPAATHRDRILSLDATLSVTIARRRIPIAQALDLAPGSVLTFAQPCAAPLEVHLAGQRLAQGRAVQVGEQLGVQILRVLPPTAG